MVKSKSGEEGNEASPQSKKDFDTFVNICKVTEQIPDGAEDGKLQDVFEVWKADGCPRQFKFTELESKVEIPIRLYRRKWKGRQFLSYVAKGKSEQVGMNTDILYGKNDAGEEDRTLVVGRERYPALEWKDSLAKEVLERAKRYSDSVELRLVFQQKSFVVTNEDNFFGDFDSLIEQCTKGKII